MVVSQLLLRENNQNLACQYDQNYFVTIVIYNINIQLQEKGTTLKEGGKHPVLMEI